MITPAIIEKFFDPNFFLIIMKDIEKYIKNCILRKVLVNHTLRNLSFVPKIWSKWVKSDIFIENIYFTKTLKNMKIFA